MFQLQEKFDQLEMIIFGAKISKWTGDKAYFEYEEADETAGIEMNGF